MIKKNQIENYEETSGIDTSTYAGKAIKAVKSKSRGIIGDDLLIFTLLDFMTFMMLNNKFASKGIFITSENREEKYIEMIESGEEDLINSLEEYINLLDKIKLLEEKKKEVDEIIFKLQCLKDYNEEEQVNEIIKDYLRR